MKVFDFVEDVEEAIHKVFPSLGITFCYDPRFDEVEIQIKNKRTYYSKKYQTLLTKINMGVLWAKNIMNVLFTMK